MEFMVHLVAVLVLLVFVLYIPRRARAEEAMIYETIDEVQWRVYIKAFRYEWTQRNWGDARWFCQSSNYGDLSTLTKREFLKLEELVKEKTDSFIYRPLKFDYSVWLGAKRRAGERNYTTVDNTPSEILYWSPGQPRDDYSKDSCAYLTIFKARFSGDTVIGVISGDCESRQGASCKLYLIGNGCKYSPCPDGTFCHELRRGGYSCLKQRPTTETTTEKHSSVVPGNTTSKPIFPGSSSVEFSTVPQQADGNIGVWIAAGVLLLVLIILAVVWMMESISNGEPPTVTSSLTS